LFTTFRKKNKYDIPYFTNPRTGQEYFNITPHTLRHYVLTTLYKKSNNNLLLCKDLAGHKFSYTTANYIESTQPEDMRQFVDML
jgi:integrase